MNRLKRAFCLPLIFALLTGAALATKEETSAAFEAAAAAWQTPAQAGAASKTYALHPGESAFVPEIAPDIVPFDEAETTVYPSVSGPFVSSDEDVVTVNDKGLMTAVAAGSATVTYQAAGGDSVYEIIVSNEIPRELAKNMAYIAQREFYATQRAKLPKYNQYAKWYYGKKKEVGWCSVFAIWCANAAGQNPIKKDKAADVAADETLYLREGQVGNQFDGFMDLDRFGGIPRQGYLVIYADMDNAYRTTHIGIVVDVVDKGAGLYQITTVEGNMSNTIKSYMYLYDSNMDNHLVGTEKGLKLRENMSQVPEEDRMDPLPQYELHTDHWSVFGFCESWK